MKHYAYYRASGEIDMVSSLPDDIDPAVNSALPFVETLAQIHPDDYWVSNGVLTAYSSAGAGRKKAFPGGGWAWNPSTEQWTDNRTAQGQWPLVRSKRNALLAASDWSDLASSPSRLGGQLYQQWQQYRQALRDITTQLDPFNIVWPTPPTTPPT